MRGGTLDRTVAIQRAMTTQSPSGEEITSWVTLSKRPAQLESSFSGGEHFVGEQFISKSQVAFKVRWSAAIADVSPLDRIIYPASALDNSPAEPLRNKIYDILMVQEVGRREALRLFAAVRQDETQ